MYLRGVLCRMRIACVNTTCPGSINDSINKYVFSYLHTLATWHCPRSPAARRCCSDRSISPARRAHSSKPAPAGLLLCAHAGTDGRTDGWTPYGFIDPAPHIMRAVLIIGDRSVTVHEYYNFGDSNTLSSKMLCIIIRPRKLNSLY